MLRAAAGTRGSQAAGGDKPLVSANDYLLARRQVAHLDGPALRAAGLQGQGLRIAVFDVGFRGLPGHPAFAELLNSKLPGVKVFRAIFFVPSVAGVIGISLIWKQLFNATVGLAISNSATPPLPSVLGLV